MLNGQKSPTINHSEPKLNQSQEPYPTQTISIMCVRTEAQSNIKALNQAQLNIK